ncbi:MAG: hypothetical protein JWO06_1546 [Bacteroidota bacterium]|nr:hypothetical protein [Bacteroidota bacterium]
MDALLSKERILCPSSKCAEGSKLIGLVKEDGHVDMLETPLEITEDFIKAAAEGRNPQSRFRFSNNCVQGACKQWTGSRCGVVDGILDHVAQGKTKVEVQAIKDCAIRPVCRWYNQNGLAACEICPLVITDVTESW